MDTAPNNDSQKAVCPQCDTPISLPNDKTPGKVLECPACGTESEIISIDPVKLAPLEEEK